MSILSPWRRPLRLFGLTAYALTAMPFGVFTFATVVALLAVSAGLMITFVIALPFAWLLFVWSWGLAHAERSRVAALTGVRIADPVPALTAPTWFGRLRERARSGPRWREIGHHLVRMFLAAVGFSLVTAAWAGSLALIVLPWVIPEMPDETAKFYFFELDQGEAWFGLAVGVIGLVMVAPWVTTGVAQLELALARQLLGPDVDAVHEAQVTRLETSRVAAVDSAETERRRIERDLHDGAQQRLVALAANLGAAREKLDADPIEGRAMVATAHEEAKEALKEIRDLVRGIHPVILEDRGLDAALSAVVARSPVPVTLDVQVAQRPSSAVESTAYFVVNEALTNVARHAKATKAHVAIARAGNRLVVEVRDDGVGGADAEAGSGLRGLHDRVAGFGGSMYVISPTGGPTTISVELPCGS